MWSLYKSPTSVVRVIAGILLCLLWVNPSIALENLRVVRGVLILEGRIDAGDYASVRNFLSDQSNFNKMIGQVFLASPGGNVFEALQIGYLIRRLRLSTDAPSRPPPTVRSSGSEIIRPLDLTNPRRYLCTSACFLLYVAGIYREFVWAGRLGLHRPQLEYKPGWATEKDAAMATADMHAKLKSYLAEMNVPNKYLEFMYSVPPTEVRLITQTELNADLKGYIPKVRAMLDAKCNLSGGTEGSTAAQKCVEQTKIELRNEAWKTIFQSSM
jgi:hypothetical protein